MSINLRQKFWLTVVISLALVSGVGWLYVSMASAVQRANSGLTQIEAQILNLEKERKEARNLERLLEERSTEAARVSAFFVDRERPIEFIEQLENLAKTTQNLIALGVDGPPAKGPELSFRITLDGTQENVTRYLKLFELIPYQVRVKDLAFQKISSEAGHDTRLTLVIGVVTR